MIKTRQKGQVCRREAWGESVIELTAGVRGQLSGVNQFGHNPPIDRDMRFGHGARANVRLECEPQDEAAKIQKGGGFVIRQGVRLRRVAPQDLLLQFRRPENRLRRQSLHHLHEQTEIVTSLHRH